MRQKDDIRYMVECMWCGRCFTVSSPSTPLPQHPPKYGWGWGGQRYMLYVPCRGSGEVGIPRGEVDVKRKPIILIVIAVIIIIAVVGVCVSKPTHTTVEDALNGSPGDSVDFEVVRIRPSAVGIANGDCYTFVVYDMGRDYIMVLAKMKDMTSKPKEMDFVKITGVLRDNPEEDGVFPIVVYASKVELITTPPDWIE
jgi:hypothetical protein